MSKGRKTLVFILAAVLVLSFGLTSYAASVTPTYYAGRENRDPILAEKSGSAYYKFDFGTTGTHTVHFDANGNVDSSGSYYITVAIGRFDGDGGHTGIVSWSSNFDVYAVLIKAGRGCYVYRYESTNRDTSLMSPIDGAHDLSHCTFYFCPPGEPDYGSLKVYKKDQDGALLAGAVFNLLGVGTGTEISPGVHVWTDVEVGTYTLSETTVPAGYTGIADRSVNITKNTEVVVNAVNNKIKKGSLTVYKQDQDGVALAGAVFTLVGIGTGIENPAGTHTWTDVPIGTYTLSETTVPAGYTGIPNQQVTILEDQTITITLKNTRKQGDFTVYKKDQNGNDLSGAVFTLTPVGGGSAVVGTESPSGTHTWIDLPTGQYTLDETVVPSGYSKGDNLPRTVTISEGSNAAITITNDRKLGDFTVYKVDDEDNALSGAVFTLTPVGGGSAVVGTESPLGTHTWSDLPTGQYTIDETVVPSGYNKGTNIPRTVTIIEGANAAITITNDRKLGDFTVYKVDDEDNALSGAVFTLTPVGGGSAVVGTESPLGTHTWSDLPTGQYTLDETVVPNGYNKGTNIPRTVTVSEGSNAAITVINSRNSGNFTVYKVDNEDNALLGAVFTLTPVGGGSAFIGMESPSGTHTWSNLPTGQYTLDETVVPSGYSKGENLPRTVTVGKGSNAAITITNDRQLGDFTVYKVDDENSALSGAVFTLTPVGGGSAVVGTESPLGTHTWSDLPTGQYTLDETVVPNGYNKGGNIPRTVTVGEGANAAITITNDRKLGDFTVYKVDDEDNALSGAVFTLTPVGGGSAVVGTESPSGTHTWSDLPTGQYTLDETVVPRGYSKGDNLPRTVTVEQGENAAITIVNDPNPEHCSLTLYKKDSNGSLISSLNITFKLETSDLSWSSTKSSTNGTIIWDDLVPDDYILTEISAPDGYYYQTQTDNVTLLNGEDKELSVTNYEYVTINALKRDINTKQVLTGAEFAIFNTESGLPTTQIGSSQFTNSLGIATFGKSYKLKAGVTYWIKELTAPDGYQNDPATALGYPVVIDSYGGNNAEDEIIFENTQLLQQITVRKYIDEAFVGDIDNPWGAGKLLDGTEFELWQGATKLDVQTLLNGTCTFTELLPGTYTIKEVPGPTTYFFTTDTDKQVEVVVKTDENVEAGLTDPTVEFFNTFAQGDFAYIKHDSEDANIVLENAVYHLTGLNWNGTSFVTTTYKLTTNSSGYASVTGLTPGYYTFKEVTAPDGYMVDPTEYEIFIRPGRTAQGADIHYTSDDKTEPGKIIIVKFIEGTTKRIPGVSFSLYKDSQSRANLVATGVTDINGNIVWNNLDPGNYVLVETNAPSGYTILTYSKNIALASGEYKVVIVYNERSTPTPTPTPTTPRRTPTRTPTYTATPSPTPTPFETDEFIIEEEDTPYGPETGEDDSLFILIAILLVMGSLLLIIRKKVILKK